MEYNNLNTKPEHNSRTAILYIVLAVAVVCIGIIALLLRLEESDVPARLDNSTQDTVTSDVEQNSQETFDNQIIQVSENQKPSFEELGIDPPPSVSEIEAYGVWADVYREVYYDYLVKNGRAETFVESDYEMNAEDKQQFTEYQKEFPEHENQ